MTELVPMDMDDRIRQAELLAQSSLLPAVYQKQPANILVAQEAATALGITPFQAIQHISVINGKMTMSAELMRSLVHRAGHMLKIEALTDTECRIAAVRREYPEERSEFTFTMADAERAGLKGGNYAKHPKAMLLARCTTLACRAVFPDIIAGISYDPDELDPVTDPGPADPVRAAAVEAVPLPDPAVSAGQVQDIRALIKQLVEQGMDKSAVGQVISGIVERPVSRAEDLTRAEAETVITELQFDIESRAGIDTAEVIEE